MPAESRREPLKVGDHIAVLGRAIAVVEQADEEHLHAVLWNRERTTDSTQQDLLGRAQHLLGGNGKELELSDATISFRPSGIEYLIHFDPRLCDVRHLESDFSRLTLSCLKQGRSVFRLVDS